MARLEAMRDAMVRGASAADAARYALAIEPASAGPAATGSIPADSGPTDADSDPTGAVADPPDSAADPGVADPAPPGSERPGGRGLRLPGAGPRARGLGRAVLALDPAAVDTVLVDAVTALGVVGTWDEVARPVLTAVAERWERTATGIEAEHLLSECLQRVFHRAADQAPPPRTARPVLLAAAPGEAHSLPLSALAAVLAGRGVGTRLLGAALPEPSLRAAVGRTGPAAVFLWAHGPGPHLEGLVGALPRSRLRCRWAVGGPGWAGQDLPPGITRCHSLTEAADLLEQAAPGPAPAS